MKLNTGCLKIVQEMKQIHSHVPGKFFFFFVFNLDFDFLFIKIKNPYEDQYKMHFYTRTYQLHKC